MQRFTKISYLLGFSALGLATVSCDTTGQEEFTEEMNPLRSVSSNILIHEDFEGSTAFTQVHQQFGTSHAFRVIGDPQDRSNHAGRFELRQNDPIQSNGKRSEVLFPRQDGNDRWYSYSVMLPSDGYATDSNREIISQWHQSTGGPPTIALKVANDKFFIRSGETADQRRDYPIADVEKDVWHDFVFHIVHSHRSDGLIEVWKNGEKVLEHKGANSYEDVAQARWKIGIYKSTWSKRETDTDRRVIFFDNVKLGNENVTLQEMTPVRNATASALGATSTSSSSDTAGNTSSNNETTSSTTETTSSTTNVASGSTSNDETQVANNSSDNEDRRRRNSRRSWRSRWSR